MGVHGRGLVLARLEGRMRSAVSILARIGLVATLVLLNACRGGPSRSSGEDTVADSSATEHQRSEVDPAIRQACDSVAKWVTRAAGPVPVDRVDGEYSDRFQGSLRNGCSFTVSDSMPADVFARSAWETLRESFLANRWTDDSGYAADGPDGTLFGLRHGERVCIVSAQWEGHDDSVPPSTNAPAGRTPYRLIAECFIEPAGR
jgi:hypothetical protein